MLARYQAQEREKSACKRVMDGRCVLLEKDGCGSVDVNKSYDPRRSSGLFLSRFLLLSNRESCAVGLILNLFPSVSGLRFLSDKITKSAI